jgi:hypothetical protein
MSDPDTASTHSFALRRHSSDVATTCLVGPTHQAQTGRVYPSGSRSSTPFL